MPNKPTQKQMLRYGTAIRTAVSTDVASALLAHSKHIERSVGHTAGVILELWHEFEVETPPTVRAALEAEAARCSMTVPALVRTLVRYWHDDIFVPSQRAKKNPAS